MLIIRAYVNNSNPKKEKLMTRHIADGATPVSGNDKFIAFIERYADCALVRIFPRDGFTIDFTNEVASYETLGAGATASARKEMKKLAKD